MKWNVCNDKGELVGTVEEATSLAEAKQKSMNFTGRSTREGTVYMVDNKGSGLYTVEAKSRQIGSLGVYDSTVSGTYQADSVIQALEKLKLYYSDFEVGNPTFIKFIG
jgi:hypothetical protein